MLMTDTSGNGNSVELPPGRLAIVEQANRIAQETATERDNAMREIERLKLKIEESNVRERALQSLVTDMESRVNTMMLVRDEAVRLAAERLAALKAINGLMRTFEIPHDPVIQGTDVHADGRDVG